MKFLVSMSCIICVSLAAFTASAAPAEKSGGLAVAEAQQALSDILDLWRGEQFEELYQRTIQGGDHGEYYFLEKMVNSLRKPACCWEKLKDVKAAYVSPDRVILIATVGMEMDGAGTRYITQSFSLSRVDGVWKVPMETIISLADSSGYRAVPRDIIEKPVP
jgi:hypothetical protein